MRIVPESLAQRPFALSQVTGDLRRGRAVGQNDARRGRCAGRRASLQRAVNGFELGSLAGGPGRGVPGDISGAVRSDRCPGGEGSRGCPDGGRAAEGVCRASEPGQHHRVRPVRGNRNRCAGGPWRRLIKDRGLDPPERRALHSPGPCPLLAPASHRWIPGRPTLTFTLLVRQAWRASASPGTLQSAGTTPGADESLMMLRAMPEGTRERGS